MYFVLFHWNETIHFHASLLSFNGVFFNTLCWDKFPLIPRTDDKRELKKKKIQSLALKRLSWIKQEIRLKSAESNYLLVVKLLLSHESEALALVSPEHLFVFFLALISYSSLTNAAVVSEFCRCAALLVGQVHDVFSLLIKWRHKSLQWVAESDEEVSQGKCTELT